ncbi:MAG: flagellar export protein FliJ [Fervidobacterium sp.]
MAFRLEKILNLRKQEEKVIKQELINLRAKIKDLETEIEKVTGSKEETERLLRTGSQSGAQLNFLLYLINMYNSYLSTLKSQLELLRKKEEEILRKYIEKRTERNSLEKLKEKVREHENFEIDRRNRLVIDEIALQKYYRKTQGNER